MQTIRQLVSSLGQYSDFNNIADVQSKLESLGNMSITRDSPAIVTLSALAKQTICDSQAYDWAGMLLEAIYDCIQDMNLEGGVVPEEKWFIPYESIQNSGLDQCMLLAAGYDHQRAFSRSHSVQDNIDELIQWHSLDQFSVQLCHVYGCPIFFNFYHHNAPGRAIVWTLSYIDSNTGPDGHSFLFGEIFNDGSVTITNVQNAIAFNGVEYSWEEMIESCDDSYQSNQLLNDLATQASFDGVVDYNKVRATVDQYKCSASEFFSDALNQVDASSCVSLLALMSKFLNNNEVAYNQGQEYYEALPTPTYTTNIIATVAVVIGSVVATILSICIQIIGVIISALVTIVSAVLSFVSRNMHLTVSSIDKNSILPTYNRPFYGQYSELLYDLDDRFATAVDEYGVAAGLYTLHPGITQACFKDVDGALITQFLINGWTIDYGFVPQCHVDYNLLQRTFSLSMSATSADAYTPASYASGRPGGFRSRSIQNDTWVTQTDLDLRQAIAWSFFNIMSSLMSTADVSDIVSGVHMLLPARWTGIDTWGNDIYSNGFDAVVDELFELNNENISKSKLYFICAYIFLVERMCNSPLVSDPDVEMTDIVADWDMLTLLVSENKNFGKFMKRNHGLWKTPDIIVNGCPAFDTSITWPSLSRSSVISTLILTTITALTAVVATKLISRYRKKKSTARLAQREKEFEDAKKAYQAEPTSENAKALTKANRRLTRAWTKAGKAGVTSYNGFATGSSDTSLSSSSGSSLLDSLSTTVTGSERLDVLYKVITGSNPTEV